MPSADFFTGSHPGYPFSYKIPVITAPLGLSPFRVTACPAHPIFRSYGAFLCLPQKITGLNEFYCLLPTAAACFFAFLAWNQDTVPLKTFSFFFFFFFLCLCLCLLFTANPSERQPDKVILAGHSAGRVNSNR
jgi:hypothetical protein